jgi:hypothetical protein
MKNELVTKESADQTRAKIVEIETLFARLRAGTSEIKNPYLRQLFRAALVPIALMVDHLRIKANQHK